MHTPHCLSEPKHVLLVTFRCLLLKLKNEKYSMSNADICVCSCLQEAAKPLAAVAAVASHRLLSVATEAFASGRPQCPSNGHRPAAESSSLALMLSALASLRALVTARLPVLDVPVVANVVKLLHQLLDKVKRLLLCTSRPVTSPSLHAVWSTNYMQMQHTHP